MELLRCNSRGLLRLIVVDKAHINALHRRLFRDSIRVLRATFFSVLYGPGDVNSPFFLAMTAIMIGNLLAIFLALVHVDCCSQIHQLRATADKFQQLNVDIDLHVRGGRKDLKQVVLAPVVALLRDDPDAHIFLFVNFCSDASYVSSVLEEVLAEQLMREGVLSINGDLDNIEKFAHVLLFTSSIILRGH